MSTEALESGGKPMMLLPASAELLYPFCLSLLSLALTFTHLADAQSERSSLSGKESKVSLLFERII